MKNFSIPAGFILKLFNFGFLIVILIFEF